MNRDGAILWALQINGDAEITILQAVDPNDCSQCEIRLDPWRDHRFKDPLGLGDSRAFVKEGTADTLTISHPSGEFSSICLVYETIGNPNGIKQSRMGFEQGTWVLRISSNRWETN